MRGFFSALIGALVLLTQNANAALYELKEVVDLKPQPKAKLVEVWIPVPYENRWQKIERMEVVSPYSFQLLKESEYGDRFIYIRHEGPLKEPTRITVKLLVEREEVKPEKLTSKPPLRYLLPDRLVPVDKFKVLAERITAGKKTDVEKLKAIYNYVVSHMKYDKSGKGWGRGDAIWACDAKRGNCTDFHSLFIALCRAAGIPARFQIGLPVNGSGEVKGYHCWVLAYPDGFVYGIDASEAAKHPSLRKYYFGHLKDNRVGITIGRDILLAPAQHGSRLNFTYKAYEEVDLKPSNGVQTYYFVKIIR
ncbi:Transglutaminase-like enzyme, putative cysteine protease [Desulfurobacterium pacificum]|uniref:Transglutaminase-like enzyme, putative cysteine protease n=2 Tax=Desulfurobacterium pacificum TaxID=240166 RepID=A0ABY1NF72_9BACT|nr:Transglutaminase-like enzyme, putative cysteine protease [Desulfurobacterium pacificum]